MIILFNVILYILPKCDIEIIEDVNRINVSTSYYYSDGVNFEVVEFPDVGICITKIAADGREDFGCLALEENKLEGV